MLGVCWEIRRAESQGDEGRSTLGVKAKGEREEGTVSWLRKGNLYVSLFYTLYLLDRYSNVF